MISSVMPSLKYSCLGSPLMLSKASHCNGGLVRELECGRFFQRTLVGRGGGMEVEVPDCDRRHEHNTDHSSYEIVFRQAPGLAL